MNELFDLMMTDYKKFIKSSEKFIETQKTKQKIKLENAIVKIDELKKQLEDAICILEMYAEESYYDIIVVDRSTGEQGVASSDGRIITFEAQEFLNRYKRG